MRFARTLALSIAILSQVSAAEATGPGTGIVRSIVKAPVVSDGDVAGEVTDIVINLDTSLDPAVPGRGLSAGNQIRVMLPEAFENTGLPIASVFTGCAPNCSAAILLQGWPQHPVGFPPPTIAGKWTVFGEGTHTIVIEALQDIVPAPPGEPGIKQIHLLLFGFRNPHPGHYEIQVEAETGPGGAVEAGAGMVHILPDPRPNLSVTSVFNLGSPNTIYQETETLSLTPFPYDFLLWDQNGQPFTGVEILGKRLVKGRRTVGQVSVVGPSGAMGYDQGGFGAGLIHRHLSLGRWKQGDDVRSSHRMRSGS